ncbi:MAG: DUF1934 domain-containing protein [Clostridia bacterium]|nr:DUF1934 domain-containing protein [Clostridia bacterium]
MKNVIIRIKGTQGLGEDKSVIEFSSEGTLARSGEGFRLNYCEDAITEGRGSIKTTLTAGKNSVVLEREGAISSKLLIEKGVRNNCFYSVPEGNLTLGIFGKEVDVRLNGNGGKIRMVYTLDTNMQLISENTVEINVRER